MAARNAALLVQPPGPGRDAVVRSLEAAGLAVATADEPYEGTARFVAAPAALVVVSLTGVSRRDLPFFQTIRARGPSARILLLVPEGRRGLAVQALAAGAHAWLPEPAWPEELRALVATLLPGARGTGRPGDPGALAELAAEVAHAVNNPLQILSLLGQEAATSERAAEIVSSEVGRIRDVVRILDRFSRVREPQRSPTAVGSVLRESLAAAEAAGWVRPLAPAPRDGPLVPLDALQVRHAIDALVEVLVARAGTRPLELRARVRPVRLASGPAVEAALKGRGVRLPTEEVAQLGRRLLWNHEETRRAHPGLAFPAAVAEAHGGRLETREAQGDTVLAFRLPRGTGGTGPGAPAD